METTRLNKRIIKNFDSLASHGQSVIRRDALEIIEAGIRGADPGRGTCERVRRQGDLLFVGDRTYDLNQIKNIYVLGAGKGSFPIAEALDGILGERIREGIVVVKKGEKRRLSHIEVFEAGHPIPDEESVAGGRKILGIAAKAQAGDLVFAAITGGCSALVIAPPAEIRLEEIKGLTNLLLASGAIIREMNAVRKHLCNLKGGRLVAAIHPAETVTLTLDTAPEGMPWPDMCLADPSTFQDAITVLKHYDIWNRVAPSIREYLLRGLQNPAMETVKTLAGIQSRVIGVASPGSACEACARRAKEIGYTPVILSTTIQGESTDVGIVLGGIAREIITRQRPFAPPCALISGGETTVKIGGTPGKGGPNQELVLGFAKEIGSKEKVVCVSVDTDGTDGPTDIAGGIVDGQTLTRLKAAGIEVAEILKRHDSSSALLTIEDTIMTGHTGTNVMNLRVLVVGK
jgi:glycerate-2-kinase